MFLSGSDVALDYKVQQVWCTNVTVGSHTEVSIEKEAHAYFHVCTCLLTCFPIYHAPLAQNLWGKESPLGLQDTLALDKDLSPTGMQSCTRGISKVSDASGVFPRLTRLLPHSQCRYYGFAGD